VRVLLVSDDLMVAARVEHELTAAGVKMARVAPTGMLETMRVASFDVAIADLDGGREALIADLATARSEGVAPATTLAFVSHVDRDLTAAARSAGVDVTTRGNLTRAVARLVQA
jgi:DNA-binding response OmpR family regulator